MTLGGRKKNFTKKKKKKNAKRAEKIEDSRKQGQNSTTFPRRSKNDHQDNKIKLNAAGRERSLTAENERQSFSKYAIRASFPRRRF